MWWCMKISFFFPECVVLLFVSWQKMVNKDFHILCRSDFYTFELHKSTYNLIPNILAQTITPIPPCRRPSLVVNWQPFTNQPKLLPSEPSGVAWHWCMIQLFGNLSWCVFLEFLLQFFAQLQTFAAYCIVRLLGLQTPQPFKIPVCCLTMFFLKLPF